MDILAKHVDMLGFKVRDKVTGFEGVIDSVCFDLYGCVQVTVKPPINKDGEVKDSRWHDIARVEVLSEQRVMPVPSFAQLATPEGIHEKGAADKPIR